MESKQQPWRVGLTLKVRKYIKRNVRPGYQGLLLDWWEEFGDAIVNEFEEVVDEQSEAAEAKALRDAILIISRDANIDKDSPDVARALHHLQELLTEVEQEVEYETDPEWENLQRERKAKEGLDS